ncbi:Probable polygalacturonase At3g15720 [Linum grandiflorum]
MDFCGASGDLPTLIVPAGKEFLLNSVSFTGPCKSPTLHFLLKGTLVAPSSISVWNNGDMESWIQFSYVTGLIINGGGKFDGRGQIWWDACRALSFHQCNGLRMKSLYHVNSQRNHISLGGSTDVRMSNLTIVAPDDSPNTDGIDISHSSNGGKGYVRRVTFERITLVEARNPIIIDQNYMSRLFVPTNPSSDVEISDVLYREVYGSTTYKEAIVFICGQQCSNIVVENVNITSATPEQQLMSVCENGSGIHSQFVIPKLTCLH